MHTLYRSTWLEWIIGDLINKIILLQISGNWKLLSFDPGVNLIMETFPSSQEIQVMLIMLIILGSTAY